IRDVHFFSAHRRPCNRWRWNRPITLPRYKNHRALMRALRNIPRIDGIRHARSLGRPDLADAIEKSIIVLPRHVLAERRIRKRHVLAPEMRRRRQKQSWGNHTRYN